jgi:hypothetical protein
MGFGLVVTPPGIQEVSEYRKSHQKQQLFTKVELFSPLFSSLFFAKNFEPVRATFLH